MRAAPKNGLVNEGPNFAAHGGRRAGGTGRHRVTAPAALRGRAYTPADRADRAGSAGGRPERIEHGSRPEANPAGTCASFALGCGPRGRAAFVW